MSKKVLDLKNISVVDLDAGETYNPHSVNIQGGVSVDSEGIRTNIKTLLDELYLFGNYYYHILLDETNPDVYILFNASSRKIVWSDGYELDAFPEPTTIRNIITIPLPDNKFLVSVGGGISATYDFRKLYLYDFNTRSLITEQDISSWPNSAGPGAGGSLAYDHRNDNLYVMSYATPYRVDRNTLSLIAYGNKLSSYEAIGYRFSGNAVYTGLVATYEDTPDFTNRTALFKGQYSVDKIVPHVVKNTEMEIWYAFQNGVSAPTLYRVKPHILIPEEISSTNVKFKRYFISAIEYYIQTINFSFNYDYILYIEGTIVPAGTNYIQRVYRLDLRSGKRVILPVFTGQPKAIYLKGQNVKNVTVFWRPGSAALNNDETAWIRITDLENPGIVPDQTGFQLAFYFAVAPWFSGPDGQYLNSDEKVIGDVILESVELWYTPPGYTGSPFIRHEGKVLIKKEETLFLRQ